MRVALADDSALFRRGLAALLAEADIDVSHEASDQNELLRRIAGAPPDAVILDIRMPPTFTNEGLTTAAALKDLYPGIGVLVLSTYDETAYALSLLEHGATGVGYLLKDRVDNIAALHESLQRVVAGGTAIDPDIVHRLMNHRAGHHPLDRLSDRERDVLAQMAQGRSNAGVGHALTMSPRTVENHVKSIFTKLGLLEDHQDNRRVLAVLQWLRASTPPTT